MTKPDDAGVQHRRARDITLLLVAIALIVATGGLVFRALVTSPSDVGFGSLYVLVPCGVAVLAVLVVVLVRVLAREGE